MTPMTCGVADAEEDGFILGASEGECFVAPREPIHRIVGVLEQIGRFLASEAVRVFVTGGHDGENIQALSVNIQRKLAREILSGKLIELSEWLGFNQTVPCNSFY
jgi:hypothetical protein